MSIISEFKAFIQRGNVIDMAVGVIMGTAFGKIVNSLVTDIIMPPIGYVVKGVNFKDLAFSLPQIEIPMPDPNNPTQLINTKLPPAMITYGNFLQTTFDFLIIAFCVFGLVKLINRLHRKQEAAPTPPTTQELLLMEIRDLLKQQNSGDAGA